MTIKQGLGMGVLVGALAIGSLVGCGSSGGSSATGGSGGAGSGTGGTTGGGNTSGGGFTTSVPSGTKLTTLTSAQATQICKDYDTYVEAHATTYCKALAVELSASAAGGSDADLQAACTAAYTECLTADGGLGFSCDPTDLMSSSASCTATVGDGVACINAQFTAQNQVPSCSSLTAATLAAATADGGVLGSDPSACAAIDACDQGDASSSSLGAIIAHRPHR